MKRHRAGLMHELLSELGDETGTLGPDLYGLPRNADEGKEHVLTELVVVPHTRTGHVRGEDVTHLHL